MVCGVSFIGLELACTLTLHTAVQYIDCSGEPLAGTTIIIVTQMLPENSFAWPTQRCSSEWL